MPTIELVVLRPFLIWNMLVKSETVFEIEDWIGKGLISRGVCADKKKFDKDRAERKEKKATETPEQPKPKTSKKGGKE